jgi:hypothetical protein
MKKQDDKKPLKKSQAKEKEVFTREDFLNFLRKVSRPKKRDEKQTDEGKKRTSE